MGDNLNLDLFKKDVFAINSNLPIYYRILTVIKHHIQTGALKPGEMLPPESKLCEIYGVSRTTIRQAMDQLSEENLITRHRGKGSFIASPRLQRNLNHMYSFSADMKNMGLNPSSKVIESSIIKVDVGMTEIFKLPAGSEIFKLVRIRYANNEPVLLETTYIPYYLCYGIVEEDFSANSLYGTLQYKYNLKLDRATETYEAVKISKITAQLLEYPTSGPGFSIHRTGYLESEIPFEYTQSTVRGDKCVFTVELTEGKKQVYFTRTITP